MVSGINEHKCADQRVYNMFELSDERHKMIRKTSKIEKKTTSTKHNVKIFTVRILCDQKSFKHEISFQETKYLSCAYVLLYVFVSPLYKTLNFLWKQQHFEAQPIRKNTKSKQIFITT